MSKPFAMNYKTYTGPRGNDASWRKAFAARMGLEEAREHIGSSTPEGILGVSIGATWAEVKKAYKVAALACHPDRAVMNGMTVEVATAKFKKLQAAYTILEDREMRRRR